MGSAHISCESWSSPKAGGMVQWDTVTDTLPRAILLENWIGWGAISKLHSTLSVRKRHKTGEEST